MSNMVILIPIVVLAGLVIGDIVAVCCAIWFLFHGQFLSTLAAVVIALVIEQVKNFAVTELDKSGL